MQFDAGTWWLIGITVTALLGCVGTMFCRTVFGKLDENSKDIKQIQQDYTPRSEHTTDIKELRNEHTTDIKEVRSEHTDDIKEVRDELKDDLKALREEQRNETRKLASDIEDIRENCLRNDNFVRTISKLENKIDLLFEKILQGGAQNG